jgi:quinol-cytochrome oxidoreductase complex cytochrome b subunit
VDSTSNRGIASFIVGAGGVLLIVALFLPWADRGGESANGWELLTIGDLFLLWVGVLALLAAVTGGRIGLFRPDLSFIAAADVFGVVASVLMAWLIIFDFPEGADRSIGVFLALIGAMAIAGGAGDYSTLRGAPIFPKLDAPDAPRK